MALEGQAKGKKKTAVEEVVRKTKRRMVPVQNELSGWEQLDEDTNEHDMEHLSDNKAGNNLAVKHGLSKNQKKSLKKKKEEQIKDIEARRKAGLIAPTNAAEFEQMVMSSPNSSYVWIQYMAYLIAQGEIERSRSTAQRALSTISFRDQDEKFNIWIALINIENVYGNGDTTDEVLQKAMAQCSQSKLLKTALDIFEQTGKVDKAEKVAGTLCKYFSDNPESWIRVIRFWLRQGDSEQAQSVFDRSMQALPVRHHVHMASQAALLEFKIGDSEKGRTIMERVLQDNPKRTDLWSVYLDQEVAHGDQHRARALFERCIHLSLAPKKMKFLFKKYLDYEKKHGDEDHIESVKRKAMEYVERLMMPRS